MEMLVTLAIFLISVPLHELSHFVAFKRLGGKGDIKIVWLSFGISALGSVTLDNPRFYFPKLARWKDNPRAVKIVTLIVGFIMGGSGGWGATAILTIIGAIFFVYHPVGFFITIQNALFFVAKMQFIYGFIEAVKTSALFGKNTKTTAVEQ